MKRLVAVIVLIFGWHAGAVSAAPEVITSLRSVHALDNGRAALELPVQFEATVTYYRAYDHILFVQDEGIGIYVEQKVPRSLLAGDRVLVSGTTRGSYLPFVEGDQITVLQHGSLPKGLPSTFEDLIQGRRDSQLVTVRGVIQTADVTLSANSSQRGTVMHLLMDGGDVDVVIDGDNVSALRELLDSEIEVTGVAGGKFDGKMQLTGIITHMPAMSCIRVLKRPDSSPWNLPLTPMNKVISGYRVNTLTPRIRIQGSVTYYQPGSAIVLQSGSKSLWVMTQTQAPVKVGDRVDATGIPDIHDGSLTLTHGEILDAHVSDPIQPLPVSWHELSANSNQPIGHQHDLVSIEGHVIMEVREAAQDEYVLVADGHLFSSTLRHPQTVDSQPIAPMKKIALGSTIRVTGICMIEGVNSFSGDVPFSVLVRTPEDIVIVAHPSLLSIRNLMLAMGLLVVAMIIITARGWRLERKVRQQTAALAARTEAEAALERQRSRILEDINGTRSLHEILEQIVKLVSTGLGGAPCWCQTNDGAQVGEHPEGAHEMRLLSQVIPARGGSFLGTLFAALNADLSPLPGEAEVISQGVQLASLALETRKIYTDLLHRSEFDLLTDIHNRFSLERHLDQLIAQAKTTGMSFGVIYIDLDRFKQINDVYGHGVGDAYLQSVALRMQRQLRNGDLLARLGGDEFAALVSGIRGRADVEDVAARLKQCFHSPFFTEGYILQGSASIGLAIYPADGASKDQLFNAADAAMYTIKRDHKAAEAAEAKEAAAVPESL